VGGSGGSAEPPVLGWVPSRTGWVGEGWKEKKRKKKRKGRKEREKGGKKKEGKKGIREINEDIIKHAVIGTGPSPLSPVSRAICSSKSCLDGSY